MIILENSGNIYIFLRETFVSFLFKILDDFFSTFFDCCFYNFVSLVIWPSITERFAGGRI